MQHHAFVRPSVDLTSHFSRSLIVRAMQLAVITLVISHGLLAQAPYPPSAAGHPGSRIVTGPGTITSTITHGDSVLDSRILDLNEEVQVIVQFVSPPLSTVRRTGGMQPPAGMSMSAVQSQIERDHASFRSALLRLEAAVNGTAAAGRTLKRSGSRVSAEYRTVFNGAALRSRRWLVERLRSLPYVRAITPDIRVHTVDSTSNHQIGADSVWSRYGLTGTGVKVGVLDTGIDYMHPDLGGGIGPGFKVAAGWSFVEDVVSPMDDHGHGTHVAGIIAADGPHLQGVAPDATLYALKVLSSDGWGNASWIMSGLERAADPDGNASTDDHLDIVNLSIGGMGDPTDALSQAIDNATAAGVLCVVAAGNDGPSGVSITSPGCAFGALTVGACDSASAIAIFSSRGPTNYLYTAKPDLLAPGEDITSTITGGSYARKSGTSMATPHVAGAAALVHQLHPSWTPAMLKGVLMGGAKDLGLDLWAQGTGRLDVLNAMRARVVAAPQTLSFGLDDLAALRWQRSDTVTVWNVSDTSVTFLVGPPTGAPAGVAVTADLPAITVPAQGSAQLVVSCAVDNTLPSVASGTLGGVTGSIALVSPGDTLRLPWALVIAPYIELQLTLPEDMTPYSMLLTPRSGGRAVASYSFAKNGVTTWHNRTVLPRGSYDVILLALQWSKFGLMWFVRDEVNVEPVATLPLSDHDQLFRVGSALKDEMGVLLDSSHTLIYASQLSSQRSGIGMSMGIVGIPPTMWDMDRVSPLSSNYVFDHYYTSSAEQPRVHSYAGQTSPVLADHVTDIAPGDLVRRDIEYRLPSTVPSLKCLQSYPFSSGNGWSYFGLTDPPPLPRPFHQVWYTHGFPGGRFPWFGQFINHMFWYDGSRDSVFDSRVNSAVLLTPNQIPGTDGGLHTVFFIDDTTLQEQRGKQLVYGLGPRHYFGRMENQESANRTSMRVRVNSDEVSRIFYFEPIASSVPFFLNQAMDAEPLNLRLALRDSAGHMMKQSSELWPEYISDWSGSLNVSLPASGRYTLRLWDPSSRVLSLKGAAFVDLTADTRLTDPNPPAMTSFTITGADSNFTDVLQPGETGRVAFGVADAESGLRSVSLSCHTDTSHVWMNIPLTLQDGRYQGTLPAFTRDDAFISLRVLASDHSGNVLEYRAEPAVHIGPDSTFVNRAPRAALLVAPASGGVLQLREPGPPVVFSWHEAFDRDGWDTLSYTFHIRGGILGSTADRWTPDTTITLWLMGLMSPDQVYTWWVEATDGHVVVSSDTATFRTSSTVLAAPGEQKDLPKEYALTQNYPNPFNPTTTIGYDLPRASHVSLVIYTMLGQEVTTMVNAEQQAGRYTITFDGRGLASGMYIYRIQATSSGANNGAPENFTSSRKLLLLR